MARRLTTPAPLAFLALPALLAACGSAPPRAGTGTPGGTGPATGLAVTRDLASGVLAYAVAYAPDGGIASVELGDQFELVLRDPAQRPRRRIALGPPEWDVTGLAIDGGTAWVASLDGTVRGFDLRTGRARRRWPLGAGATAVAARAGWIATGSATGVVCLRRGRDGALLQCVAAHREAVAALAFDRGGARLVSAARDGTAILWDVPSLRIAARHESKQPLADAAFAPDGARIALAEGTRVSLWSPTGGAVHRCGRHRGEVTAVAWLADGALLSGARDRTVALWRTAAAGCVQVAQLPAFVHQVRDVAVAARARQAAIAAWAPDLKSRATAVLALLYGGGR
jgi:WD40 repeat protein